VEAPRPCDLLVRAGTLLTQDADRRILTDAAVAIVAGAIAEVGDHPTLAARWQASETLDASDALVMPGLIDAHHHCTADPLVRSLIPDEIDSQRAIFEWATPLHAAVRPEDDALAATLTAIEALRNGTTTLIEAGTVAHPERVAAGLAAAGMRGGVGCWGWDTDGLPYAAPADEVLDRQRGVLDAFPKGGLVEGWVTLVGHELVSDALLAGAAELARMRGTGLTFHISPTEGDVHAYLARDGLRPVRHLERLGVLGPHLLLAHAVWLDADEAEAIVASGTAVAYCPWAYLRLGQGVTRAGRHAGLIARGARIALGCDSANAADMADLHRVAALAVGLARDMEMATGSVTAATGLDLLTVRGAEAIGMGARVGSIEAGKRADLIVHELSGPCWRPRGRPDLNLIWGTDGRSVRDVVVDGRIVVRDGRSTLIDEAALAAEAMAAQDRLLRDAGIG
jgi:5-methylthioadenosine/S-adenosylhomocysteine deaminase